MNILAKLLEKANQLPLKPGIYQMLDKNGTVLYVGKAKILKNRVSSYFSGAHDNKTTQMLSKVHDFSVILCATEFEALVLECSLIKEKKPRYNILLKDGKGYPHIRLDTTKAYPRFSITANPAKDKAKYFGPYGGRFVTREAIETLCHAFALPTCSRVFPRDIGKERPCLNKHLGLCLAYCSPDTPKSTHDERIGQAILVLEGKVQSLIQELSVQMEQAATDMRFEQAASIRDRIRAIEKLSAKQNVVSLQLADTDVLGYYQGASKSGFSILHYIDGSLLDKEYEIIDTPLESPSAAISAILKQFYGDDGLRYPKAIYLPFEIDDQESLEALLLEKAGHKVEIHIPKRGDKLKLVENAMENAKAEVERFSSKEEKVRGILTWLSKALNLPAPPMRMEAYDVSNFGDSDIVAVMTVFENARPKKSNWRKFRIKTVLQQDDYHSMEEVLSRRFTRFLSGDPGFSQAPDLLLIDGGATHVSVAQKVLDTLGLSIPVFGMVKDEKHRTRALTTKEGDEISMTAVPQVFSFIANIQEETHRFAISYQRSLRSKQFSSGLDHIPGVGEVRRNTLLKHFKTIKNIQSASFEELASIVPKHTAKAVYDYFTKKEDTVCVSLQEQQEDEN